MRRRVASVWFQSRGLQRAALALCATALLSASLCMTLAQPARAADLRWRNKPFTIVANGKKIADFIRELAASQGVTAVVDPKVDGVISGRFSGTPQQTLDTICSTYGLTWYYDGSFLYVDPADQSQTQMIPIPPNAAGEIGRALQAMQVADKRFTLVINDRANSVYVAGPRRYVELVRQAIGTVGDPAANGQHADVRAFRLKYGWASDVTINRSGREVVVPGVATILRRLFGKGGGGTNLVPASAPLGQAARQVKLGSGLTIAVPRLDFPDISGGPRSGGYGGAYATDGAGAFSPFASTGGGDTLPQIEADPAINAVIVRDLPENMYRYQSLIGQLDERPRIVEINVTIIDINEDSLDSLGIDWRLHTKHGDVQIGNGANPLTGNTQFGGAGNPPLTFGIDTSEAGQIGAFMPTGIALTASIGGSLRNYLLTRVNALAQKGQAQLHSKPKVLALDNTEAILENLTQFYVQVQGYQDSSLYSVTTGTSIKVTPMIVDEAARAAAAGGPQSVMMSIDIQDGNIVPGQAVSNVPVIQQRNIVTKTMIDEGKSLLIAGFNDDEVRLNKSGVPWLSDIPLIGNLFKYTDKTGNHMERFYLLTPRVVTTASMYAPDGSPVNPGLAVPPNPDGLSMYRPPDNDVAVPLTPKPLPGTKFGPPALPPPKDAAAQPAMTAGAPAHVDDRH
ncbi:EscC/YscC/HrcC family type III secretion system outer membrane ring protein [Burkholderia ubonensis]|uniref:type III secretion system outer membrane ring subunit SctC n=1 Tax=Burkholderia ubonensis TaxID=101571 RepID=UPI0007591A6A|nr:type III secretion system outer membrane ring subunit SctC [Burkholderia ubonensis]KVP51834.1 secretin [Burkholderia ubonensis]OJB13272.1 EscC/YscC/HrcC family type III secretion system outer membrane ring protein [Burkholderia ubonensis]OJB17597.1 EscC/YscC/HrcC family type III secretion system outer membrane ring protein [Burkholderia ubonensis]OJB50972.1 EscC/YscC/HrcC family type III secretion system outer membrane ring protein [Burkholderia ubonensis]